MGVSILWCVPEPGGATGLTSWADLAGGGSLDKDTQLKGNQNQKIIAVAALLFSPPPR